MTIKANGFFMTKNPQVLCLALDMLWSSLNLQQIHETKKHISFISHFFLWFHLLKIIIKLYISFPPVINKYPLESKVSHDYRNYNYNFCKSIFFNDICIFSVALFELKTTIIINFACVFLSFTLPLPTPSLSIIIFMTSQTLFFIFFLFLPFFDRLLSLLLNLRPLCKPFMINLLYQMIFLPTILSYNISYPLISLHVIQKNS